MKRITTIFILMTIVFAANFEAKTIGTTPDLRNIIFPHPVLGSQTVEFAALVKDGEDTLNFYLLSLASKYAKEQDFSNM